MIDGKGTDGASAIVRVGLGPGVEILARGVQTQLGRRVFAGRLAEDRDGTGRDVDFAVVDGGVLTACIVADVDEQALSHGVDTLLIDGESVGGAK